MFERGNKVVVKGQPERVGSVGQYDAEYPGGPAYRIHFEDGGDEWVLADQVEYAPHG